MTVRLTRTSWGGGTGPDSWGVEVDDAGRANAWQTSGQRVGRFARELSASERAGLDRALTQARAAGPPEAADPRDRPIPPSGTTEQLIADGLPGLTLDPHEPPAAVADLFARLNTLRQELADSPVAAIELELTGSPRGARLRHLGSEPVAVRMGTLTLQGTVYDADSAVVDRTAQTIDASGTASPVGPGWTLPLVEDLGLPDPPPGGFLIVTVGSPEVDSLGDGVLRAAELGWMIE